MKTAKDISPSAVLLLGLGLLVGNTMLPQFQKLDDAVAVLPLQEATTPSLTNGRSLERLPDVDDALGEVESELRFEVALGNETAVQELVDLLQRQPAEKPVLMSDSAAVTMIASFIVLGVAATFTDVSEFAKEEEEAASNTANQTTNAEPADMSAPTQQRSSILKAFAFGLIVMAAAAVVQRLYSFDLSDTRSHAERRPPLVPDSYVISMLTVFIILGFFVMKSDIREMAEEMRKSSAGDVHPVDDAAPSHSSPWCSSRLLMGAGVLLALASIGAAMCCKGRLATNFADQASSAELKALAQIFDRSFNVLLDFVLELFLGACTVIGLAVMRVDVRDMVKQLQYEAGPKGALPPPSRKKVE